MYIYIYICRYIYIYIYIYNRSHRCRAAAGEAFPVWRDASTAWPLHDIVVPNIVWCIAYTREGRRGSRILSSTRAIVLHQGGQCRWAGGMKRWLIHAQQSRSQRISCKGQSTAPLPRLALSLYKILFYVKALLWESIILLSPPPSPAKPTLLQYYCTTIALYKLPHRPPLCMPYNIHYR